MLRKVRCRIIFALVLHMHIDGHNVYPLGASEIKKLT